MACACKSGKTTSAKKTPIRPSKPKLNGQRTLAVNRKTVRREIK